MASGSGRPFQVSEFEKDSFSARDFIMEKRKKVELAQLQQALTLYSKEIHSTLVELINAKYSDFVSLSSQMKVVDGYLNDIWEPIRENHEFAKGFSDEVQKALETVRSHLDERKEIALKIASIKKHDEMKEKLNQAKEILDPPESEHKGFGEDIDFVHIIPDYIRMEIVANDLKRIFIACECDAELDEPSPAMKDLEVEARKVEAKLLQRVNEGLHKYFPEMQSSWKADGPDDQLTEELTGAAHLCRALVALRRAGDVEVLIGDLFVSPELLKTWEKVQEGSDTANPAVAVDAKFASFLDAVLDWLKSSNTSLMWLIGHLTPPVKDDGKTPCPFVVFNLHLLCNGVLKAALQHIDNHFPNVFSMSTHADVFVNNYRRCRQFITDFANLMPKSERRFFTEQSIGNKFMAKWKTQVYFVMRQNEHLRALETVGSVTTAGDGYSDASAPTAGISNCNFQATAVVCEQLTLLWDEKFYLGLLFSKGLRLSVEMTGRYSSFMQKLLVEKSKDSQATMAIAADISKIEAFLAEDGPFIKLVLSRLDPRTSTESKFSGAHDKIFNDAKNSIVTVFQESIGGLVEVRTQVENTVIEATTVNATEQFSGLRGVAGLYRMQNKPAPTRASPYVDAALKGVKVLAKDWRGPKDCIDKVLDSCCESFANALSVEMESLARQERSLKKFAKQDGSASGGGVDAATLSDMDKIQIQLHLDVDTFLKQSKPLRAAGASGPDSSGEKKLRDVVAPIGQNYSAYLATLS